MVTNNDINVFSTTFTLQYNIKTILKVKTNVVWVKMFNKTYKEWHIFLQNNQHSRVFMSCNSTTSMTHCVCNNWVTQQPDCYLLIHTLLSPLCASACRRSSRPPLTLSVLRMWSHFHVTPTPPTSFFKSYISWIKGVKTKKSRKEEIQVNRLFFVVPLEGIVVSYIHLVWNLFLLNTWNAPPPGQNLFVLHILVCRCLGVS